jgi:hypothetical protein
VKKLTAVVAGLFGLTQSAVAKPDMSVNGDKDRWMLLEREAPTGQPLVVLTRTDNVEATKSLEVDPITVVHCRADAALVNNQGMPQHSERIYPLEDSLSSNAQLQGARALHLASVTGLGERRIIYAHTRPIDFPAALEAITVEGYTCSAEAAGDRSGLIALIRPTDLDRQLDGDRSVIANLVKEGDDLVTPRRTDFFFYGQRQSLEELSRILSDRGYRVAEWRTKPVGLVLHREMPVDLGTFHDTTPDLLEICRRLKIEYDGWETFVVRPKSNSANGPDPSKAKSY